MTKTRRMPLSALVLLALVLAACTTTPTDAPTTGDAAPLTAREQRPETTVVDEPTTTTSTITTTTTASGSMSDPIPAGDAAEVGDWEIRVLSVTADASDIVAAENSFNDPPADGHQYFMAHLEATYTGTESGTFWLDITTKALGPSAVAYEFDARCGVIPDSITDASETFPGGTVTGNLCWEVRTDDATNLIMLAEESFSFNSTRVAFALVE